MVEAVKISPDPDRSRIMTAASRSISAKAGGSSAFYQEGASAYGGGAAGGIARLFNSYAPLGYFLPWEVLDHVELLSTYNPDYSQAVDNIRSLANSGHQLVVEAGSDLRQRRVKSLLEEKARTIQESHGGIDGVIDKLLDQAATYGAMCFAAETKIITNRGIKSIGDLAGQEVHILTKGGAWRKAPIRSFGTQRIYELSVRRGKIRKTIRTTAEHRWLTEAHRGSEGAYAVRPPKGTSRSLSTWQVDCRTDALNAGQRLVTQLPAQQRGVLDMIDIDPFGVARGIVYGDGALRNPDGRSGSGVGLCGSKANDLMKWFPLSKTTTQANGDVIVRGTPSYWKTLPDIEENNSYLMGWLAGYFAADGSLGANGVCRMTSSNPQAMEFFRDALTKIGVPILSERDASGVGGGGAVRVGHYEKHILSFRSRDLPERFFIRDKHRMNRTEGTFGMRPWVVESVTETDVFEEVYCATVPEFECFALEGNILTGNCGEWVLSEDLTDIVDFIDINPKHIRFFWDVDLQRWWPYQKVNGQQAAEAADRGQEVRNGSHVRLNGETFKYFAFDAAPQSPYGTPPFIAALLNIGIQGDLIENMSQIVKKLGLLGIVDMTLEQLPQAVGESKSQYEARAASYLDAYAVVVNDMVRDGGIVHFDDAELKTTNLSGNAAGATNIFKQNEELIFSGLKSMPSVQGRSYSTTETYAGVAYDIIIRNTKKYQRACKRMIETGYWLMVGMRGENPDSIGVKFHPNKTLQRMQDAQANEIEIRNDLTLWANGIIDQQDVAQRQGFDSPSKIMDSPATLTSDNNPKPAEDAEDEAPA